MCASQRPKNMKVNFPECADRHGPAAAGTESRMRFPDQRTLSVLLTTLLVTIVCVVLYRAWQIILLFVLAIFFAYLINPVVKFLERHSLLVRNVRGPAVLEVYVGILILAALLGYAFAPGALRRVVDLVDDVPTVLDGMSNGEIATDLGSKYGWSEKQEIRLKLFLLRHKENVQDLVKVVDDYISHGAEVLGCLLLIPILAIFFLRDGDHIADVLTNLAFPKGSRETVRAVIAELHIMLTQYVRAQAILCGLSFAFYSVVMMLLRFPHALVLAVLGGLLEFVPVAGWMTTAALVIGIGMINHLHWIWMILLLALWRVTQDYFTLPRIMGRELEVHPLAVILAMLVGAKVGGIVGVYLAIPLAAALRVFWQAYATPPRREERVHDSNAKSTEFSNWAGAATN